ncbi:ATP-binding protein [Stigmatella sp. ncwal1]|uniref:histidine kinase n=1 Tax=Stigmatella ashevillensis TaxID=2995309 RepID=A0ABT5DH42_9BACT|nr:ATP-binding protein [Stigmatella ashevillena]MDC0712994.1 ATP-binding protein [Stigmatella ashevillena]
MRDAHAINLSWLLRLRWGAVVAQAALILGAHFVLEMHLPLVPLFATIGVAVLSNAALGVWSRKPRAVHGWTLWGVMALDVVLLTVLLAFSGGPFNPFSTLYLVHIALAAVVLRARWTWTLVALALGCFGALFVRHLWMPGEDAHAAHHHMDAVRMHLEGMWAAFGLAAAVIVYFVQRVTRALAEREAELDASREVTARNEKLAALATLAAGAAHELSTPLSTIAVVARELERRGELSPASREDAQLIRQQVARCRDILVQMAADAGASHGEAFVPLSPALLVDGALEGLRGRERVQVDVQGAPPGEVMSVPARALTHAIRGVVKNALQASSESARVELVLTRQEAGWRLLVKDEGSGMAAEVLSRAGEPFFTTKPQGEGMGLGLFLARAVLDQLGGRLEVRSVPGKGTHVELTWPARSLRQFDPLSPVARGASLLEPGT